MKNILLPLIALLFGSILGINQGFAQAHPVCSLADSDSDGDGYGWENEQTCIVDTQLNRCENRGDFPWGWDPVSLTSCRLDEQAVSNTVPSIFSIIDEPITLNRVGFTESLLHNRTIQCRTFADYNFEYVIGSSFFEGIVPNLFTERVYSFDSDTNIITETGGFVSPRISSWQIVDGNILSDVWQWWFLLNPAHQSEPLPLYAEELNDGIWAYYKTTDAGFPRPVSTHVYACRFI